MSQPLTKVGIVGASGYTGEELVRVLARHPHVQLAAVCSRTLAGKAVADEIPRLRGIVDAGLLFSASSPAECAASDVAVWFLALPHGVAAEYAQPLIAAGKRVLDLSADFRLRDLGLYKKYYGHDHPAPALAAAARYVVPELQLDDAWKQAQLIACPGCYPTSIQVPLVPLLRAGLVKPEPGRLIINSYSGVSGAGKKADVGYLFCERDSSIKAYGIPGHRHIAEIEEQFGVAAGQPVVVQFNPHLAPMHRGIATTIVVPAAGVTAAQVEAVWQQAYAGRPFVSVLKSGDFPDTAHVANTNRVAMSVVADARTGNLIITSVIDNLLKGAGGQAVQALNLLMGWSETAGLR
ncbi:MAG: N-acetyl-gamma-glutamyl-phosphate reductase [Opitutia bacterium AMD-G3]|jgi:N-acetyl-gamma-glutamyl-phosphate reductase|nr:MAG: N-acetyl-gamma-glutamyl-phosphate reductase [Opitutae bacterium AMD-G3]